VLEKMDMDTGRWVPAGEVGPDKDSFTVDGLTPKKKYKIRVKAVNKEGESEPLEMDEAITAKNPYGMLVMAAFTNNYAEKKYFYKKNLNIMIHFNIIDFFFNPTYRIVIK